MSHLSLADNVLVIQDTAPQIASANVTGANIDMQGWDGCMFEFNIGAMASGATFTSTVYQSANANMSGSGPIPNATLTSVANTGNTNVYLLDVWGPTTRYVRCTAVPAVGNVAFAATATRYRRIGDLPQPQSAQQVVLVSES